MRLAGFRLLAPPASHPGGRVKTPAAAARMFRTGARRMYNRIVTDSSFLRNPPRYALVLLLLSGTAAVFGRVGGFGFIPLDDPLYVTANPMVQDGLTWKGIAWAFTTFHASNYHPLTWLSHMLDVGLFGLDPGAHHLVNLALHLLNGAMLFLVLLRMTGETWKSWIVAALFSVHPLHVESVAWVAERKDVLSTFFLMAALWAYARRAERPDARSLVPVALFQGLSLLSKPTFVTLPFALLLLDYWPLRRVDAGLRPLIAEKWPLFALSAGSCAVTYYAQAAASSVAGFEIMPLGMRISNAAVSYAVYLAKTLLPCRLTVFYPYPDALSPWAVGGAALLLGGISAAASAAARRAPYLFPGWFWFLGTLVPMAGLVQVGEQAMAERYSYVPLIGVFAMIAWGVPAALSGLRHHRRILGPAAAAWLVALGVAAWIQAGYWRDPVTLFRHALEVTPKSDRIQKLAATAENDLGMDLLGKGRYPEATDRFRKALDLMPLDPTVLTNLGASLASEGKLDEAAVRFGKVLEIRPGDARAHANLGKVFLAKGRPREAIVHFRAAIGSDSADGPLRQELEEALRRLSPGFPGPP